MSASATRAKVAKGPPRIGGSLLRLAIALAAGYSILAVGLGYWQVVQSQNLSEDPRNPLVVQASRSAPRGQILAADGQILARNNGRGANSVRVYPYAVFAPVIGYKSLLFGTAGLERAYDQQLIGLRTLSPGDLEVALLARGNGRRCFRRLGDDEIAALLPVSD